MHRGTTQDYVIDFEGFDLSSVSVLWITFSQLGTEKFTKTLDDVTIEDSSVTISLSQQDTLSLRANSPVYIQVRIKTNAGEALVSETIKKEVGEILKDGVIE